MADWQRYWRECCASVCFQLAVITHGFQADQQFPGWPLDLAQVINQSHQLPHDPEVINRSVVTLEGNVDPGGAPNFIIFDWATKSRQPGAANSDAVAGRLHDVICERISAHRRASQEPLNIQFIGHSRGTYVNASVIRRLKRSETSDYLGFLQMTTLDPQNFGPDGILTSNPGGIVDWAENYYQMAGGPVPDVGRTLPGALNVDLTAITWAWDARGKAEQDSMFNHSEVHDWYHWTFCPAIRTPDPLLKIYRDPRVARVHQQLVVEQPPGTLRQVLYGTKPVVESFNAGVAPAFNLRGAAKVQGTGLLLTESQQHTQGSAFCTTKFRGNITAEFDFVMVCPSNSTGGDGLTFTVLDGASGQAGKVGSHLGYAGLSGFAVAFDTHHDAKYHDPSTPATKISWRLNGEPRWQPLSDHEVPEPTNNGKFFRARVTVTQNGVKVLLYSFGSDQLIKTEGKFPPGFPVPDEKYIGFTAGTGDEMQCHWIDDVIIVPEEIASP